MPSVVLPPMQRIRASERRFGLHHRLLAPLPSHTATDISPAPPAESSMNGSLAPGCGAGAARDAAGPFRAEARVAARRVRHLRPGLRYTSGGAAPRAKEHARP